MSTDDDAFGMKMAAALQRLRDEDAAGQLRRRDGFMAQLGSEGGAVRLDWVEGVARLLEDAGGLEEVEEQARALWARGVRHVVWAGMGGSIIGVRVLAGLGLCGGPDGAIISTVEGAGAVTIHPLDSTDPAALNEIVRRIALAKKLTLPPASGERAAADAGLLRALLDDVLMVGVSMGMTSEEPITHLTLFASLLDSAGLPASDHMLVMTLPGSYLDRFAQEHTVLCMPLQLDGGTGTGGRMSAPATRVFLLPAALCLLAAPAASMNGAGIVGETGRLRQVLERAWSAYNLDLAVADPAAHAFVRLAAALSAASENGACRLLLDLPPVWRPLLAWIEQLMEESLGKAGKGVVVFDDQPLDPRASAYRAAGVLRMRVTDRVDGAEARTRTESGTETGVSDDIVVVSVAPYLQPGAERSDLLAGAATYFLGWQLTMALYGYLHDITFAGQPAVELYKTRARVLRAQDAPLHAAMARQRAMVEGPLTLLSPPGQGGEGMAGCVAEALSDAATHADGRRRLGYLDVTMNGELPAAWAPLLHEAVLRLGPSALGVPARLRRAPAAYHSTEQSEMDGPPFLVSLRLVTRTHEVSLLGSYTDAFLQAQAVSAWQAMVEQGHPCFLLIVDDAGAEATSALGRFLHDVEEHLREAHVV